MNTEVKVIKAKPVKKAAKAKKTEVVIIDHLQPVIAKYDGVMLTKAQKYSSDYAEPMAEFNELSKAINLVKDRLNPTKEECKMLYTNRQAMVKIRTRIGAIKDSQKETMKLEDKCIMSLHNTGIDLIKLTEAEFIEIEKVEERREKDRLDKLLADRTEMLSAFGEVNKHIPLQDMDEESFLEYFNDQKILFETKQESKRKEDERIRLEAIEQEKLKAQLLLTQEENNKKLKRQAKLLKELVDLGFTFDGENIFSVDKIIFEYSNLLTIEDDEYTELRDSGVKRIQAQAKIVAANQAIADGQAQELAEQHKKLMSQQYQNRCNIARMHLTMNGFVSDEETKTMVNTVYGISYDWSDYNQLETQEDLDFFCSNVDLYLADESKKAEDKARKSPDREKIVLWTAEFDKLCKSIPALTTDEGKVIENGIRESTEIVKKYIKTVYPTLK